VLFKEVNDLLSEILRIMVRVYDKDAEMNEWEKRSTGHRVWREMENLGPAIDSALNVSEIEEAESGIERVRMILAFTGKRLASIDPSLLQPAQLESIAEAFASTRTDLAAFVSDQDYEHVRNANVQSDVALRALAQMPAPSTSEELEVFVASIKAYRSTLDEGLTSTRRAVKEVQTKISEGKAAIAKLEAQIFDTQQRHSLLATEHEESVRSKLTELSEAIQLERQKLTELLIEQQKQFSEAQEKRIQDHTEAIRVVQNQVAQTTAEQQGQFSTAQDLRSRDFLDSQTSRQTKFDGLLAEYVKYLADQNAAFTLGREEASRDFVSHLNELETEYSKKAQEILSTVEQHKDHVEKLVGVIGNLGVTSGYQKTANQSRFAMWVWQGITVFAIFGLIMFAWYTLPLVQDKNGLFHWGIFAGRVFLALACGVLAAYAGSQADKLFSLEARNRRVALELEAIGPYLTPLPAEEQTKFRILIGERSFGREDASSIKNPDKSPATLLDLLGSKEGMQLLQLIGDIVRKDRPSK
jgi:hypothetical protein